MSERIRLNSPSSAICDRARRVVANDWLIVVLVALIATAVRWLFILYNPRVDGFLIYQGQPLSVVRLIVITLCGIVLLVFFGRQDPLKDRWFYPAIAMLILIVNGTISRDPVHSKLSTHLGSDCRSRVQTCLEHSSKALDVFLDRWMGLGVCDVT